MSWIESHQALEKHPKVLDLARRMGWSLDETIGKLHRLWWWCLDFSTDGDLRKYNAAVLAGSVGISPEQAENFISTMVEVRLIDEKPYRRIHDWWDYAGRYLQVRYKHNPAKWQEVREVYLNSSNNGSKSLRKNRSKNHIPTNLDRPTNQNKSNHLTNPRFIRFWDTYPERNGKKIEQGETSRRFNKLSESDQELAIQAAQNYATSKRVKDGFGKDPKRFLGNNGSSQYWRDWVTPEKLTFGKESRNGKHQLPRAGFDERDYRAGVS
jgi:hypothetical protein